MEEKINILLILKNENCLTEVIDFLLKTDKVQSYKDLKEEEFAYIGGPPTVFGENGTITFRVHFILKSFDTIKYDINNINQSMYLYDAVVIFLSDEADAELILDFMRSPYYSNLPESHSLTIIEKSSEAMKTKIQNLGKVKSVDLSRYRQSSRWSWEGRIASHWITEVDIAQISRAFPEQLRLWNYITKHISYTTRLSYNSESMLRTIISVFDFFYQLMITTHYNIDVIVGGTETISMYLVTLTRRGDSYIQEHKQAKELLIQLNILNFSDLSSLLRNEMEQLAYHLSRLAILCDEIVNFSGDLPSQLFHNFSGLEQFGNIYYSELQTVNRENITEVVLYSLDAMSEMKYAGKYIKDVLGIEKLNALKGFLRRPYSLRIIDTSKVPTTIVDNPLGSEEKQDNQHENRIGNIQLLKSLQNTLQEFTEELKAMRQLQEQYTKVITKDNIKISEELSNLRQDNRELKENLGIFENDNKELKERLINLEQKLDEASMK